MGSRELLVGFRETVDWGVFTGEIVSAFSDGRCPREPRCFGSDGTDGDIPDRAVGSDVSAATSSKVVEAEGLSNFDRRSQTERRKKVDECRQCRTKIIGGWEPLVLHSVGLHSSHEHDSLLLWRSRQTKCCITVIERYDHREWVFMIGDRPLHGTLSFHHSLLYKSCDLSPLVTGLHAERIRFFC